MPELTKQPYFGQTPNPAEATRDALSLAQNGRIALVEVFYSLQGEGLRAGQATVFVRTAGCNCDCWFCDTDFRAREALSLEQTLSAIEDAGRGCRWVCLTGGEPTIQDLGPLCNALHARSYRIQMETNGARPRPQWLIDHATVSPKIREGARLDPWYFEHAAEFKHVIDGVDDIALALDLAGKHDKPVSLQPNALSGDAPRICVEAVRTHPDRLRLSLQTHKLLQIR